MAITASVHVCPIRHRANVRGVAPPAEHHPASFIHPLGANPMSQNESVQGTVMPYGVAIREAAASGDESRIRQVSQQARQWLKDNPSHANQGEVHAALREVDEAQGGS
jgi:hypothetical protein